MISHNTLSGMNTAALCLLVGRYGPSTSPPSTTMPSTSRQRADTGARTWHCLLRMLVYTPMTRTRAARATEKGKHPHHSCARSHTVMFRLMPCILRSVDPRCGGPVLQRRPFPAFNVLVPGMAPLIARECIMVSLRAGRFRGSPALSSSIRHILPSFRARVYVNRSFRSSRARR